VAAVPEVMVKELVDTIEAITNVLFRSAAGMPPIAVLSPEMVT
jgi:hypothetical protein